MIRDIDRRIRRALATVRQAVRAVQTALNTSRPIATVQADGLAGEQFQDAEMFQHYGYTSAPPAGAEHVVIPIGGKSAHGVSVASEHRASRKRGLQPGESALYTSEGDYILLKNGRIIEVVAGTALTVNAPTVTVTATTKVLLDTPQTELTGALTVAGAITGQGGLAISGGSGASITGSLSATGDVTAGSISLKTHTHPGDSGGTTGAPQ